MADSPNELSSHPPLPDIEIPPLQLLITAVPVIVLLLCLADYMLA